MLIVKTENQYRISFDSMPRLSTRAKLKNIGFKWSASKRAWTGDINQDTDYFTQSLAFDLSKNQITNADCLQLLPTLPKACIDMVLTDPPYVVGYKDRAGRTIKNDRNTDWIAPAFQQIHRVLKRNSICISFYGWNHIDSFMSAWKQAGFTPVGHLVFRKRYASTKRFLAYHHECAYLLAKGRPQLPIEPIPDVIDWVYSKNKHHPTEKSVTVLEPLINSFTNPGDIVLDPFAGSASTAIAANNLNRNFLAIEKDTAFYEIAIRRLQSQDLH